MRRSHMRVCACVTGKLEEESIRDNFVVIHELLDEMLDFGYPQVTNTKLLQEFIKTEHHQGEHIL